MTARAPPWTSTGHRKIPDRRRGSPELHRLPPPAAALPPA
ncbi:hypothetical protein A2U01_0099371, partial [Trifolium medium]|nr:hypothetical protein [Trifolium medium]